MAEAPTPFSTHWRRRANRVAAAFGWAIWKVYSTFLIAVLYCLQSRRTSPNGEPKRAETAAPSEIHIVEVITGFCIACILTLSFMGPLHVAGKFALCVLSVSLPCLVIVHIDLRDVSEGRHSILLGTRERLHMLSFALVFIGFAALLWEVYCLAAILFILVSAIVFLIAAIPAAFYCGEPRNK
jgi:hypothetical protein